MAASDNGLLCIYAECGPHIREADLNEWFDNEHVPARLPIPGFSTAIHYKATDGKPPSCLIIYDLISPYVPETAAYTALRSNTSLNERSILSKIDALEQRVYSYMAILAHSETLAILLAENFVLLASIEVEPEAEGEFNRWFEKEYLPLLSKVPGWLRSRRYQLLNHTQLAGIVDSSTKAPSKYLVLHDLEGELFQETREFKAAMSTPWSVEILKETTIDSRLFAVHKKFLKRD